MLSHEVIKMINSNQRLRSSRPAPFLRKLRRLTGLALLALFISSSALGAGACTKKTTTCLKRAVKDGEYIIASTIYNSNLDELSTPKQQRKMAKHFDLLAKGLLSEYEPIIRSAHERLGESDFDPLFPSTWEAPKEAIENALDVLASYDSHRILDLPQYKSEALVEFANRFSETVVRVQSQGTDAFLAFDHLGPTSFFKNFPTATVGSKNAQEIVSSALPLLAASLNELTPEQLRSIYSQWTDGDWLLLEEAYGPESAELLASIYFRSIYASVDFSRPDGVVAFLETITADSEGLHLPEEYHGSILLVVEDLSPSDQLDLLSSTSEAIVSVDSFGPELELEDYRYVFVLASGQAIADQKTVSRKTIDAEFLADRRQVSNPAYLSAQNRYTMAANQYNAALANNAQASNNLNQCQAVSTVCIVQSYSYGASIRGVREAEAALEAAQNSLSRTSTVKSEDVYQTYELSVSEVETSLTAPTVLIAYDPTTKSAFKVDGAATSSAKVQVANNLHPSDHRNEGRYKGLQDVETSLSKKKRIFALDHLAKTLSSNDPITLDANKIQASIANEISSLQATEIKVMSVSQVALGSVSSYSFHPAIPSVVVVHRIDGGIGTGFYISGDLVITNQHVVGDSKYVEIEAHTGDRTTAEILYVDIDRDLALLRSNAEGKPLSLFSKSMLELGASVQALGHPSGLRYTLTEGIISGVREQASTNSAGFGEKYLYVQTDTPISPGNSGGPLLFKGKVVGVNTEKIVKDDVEGIGFALHYTEIARFLAASMAN